QHNEIAGKSKFVVNAKDLRKEILSETEVDDSKVKLIKVIASNICVLGLDEEDLPRSSISVTLVSIVSDNPEISDDKITLNITAREYLNDQLNGSLLFNLYHFPEEAHLLSISTKASRGSSLFITGYLSFIEDLLLVKITQINFIESSSSLSYKPSNYAWEKKHTNEQPSSS
ncbi:14468_t:CDS:2, partial [Funneliformis caledonium]